VDFKGSGASHSRTNPTASFRNTAICFSGAGAERALWRRFAQLSEVTSGGPPRVSLCEGLYAAVN
jgi:hypothetical protein